MKRFCVVAVGLLMCFGLLFPCLSFAQESRLFEACVYDKATRRPITGANVQMGTPSGGLLNVPTPNTLTGKNGCVRIPFQVSYGRPGAFIEVSVTVRGKQYRERKPLPPLASMKANQIYHYDFFLDIK